MLANSFCAFLGFRALILAGFFQLHLKAVFMSARSFLTANVSHGTLGLVLCLVGMHSAAKWVLTKFSFGVCVSVFSFSASNFDFITTKFLQLLSCSWIFLLFIIFRVFYFFFFFKTFLKYRILAIYYFKLMRPKRQILYFQR